MFQVVMVLTFAAGVDLMQTTKRSFMQKLASLQPKKEIHEKL